MVKFRPSPRAELCLWHQTQAPEEPGSDLQLGKCLGQVYFELSDRLKMAACYWRSFARPNQKLSVGCQLDSGETTLKARVDSWGLFKLSYRA